MNEELESKFTGHGENNIKFAKENIDKFRSWLK